MFQLFHRVLKLSTHLYFLIEYLYLSKNFVRVKRLATHLCFIIKDATHWVLTQLSRSNFQLALLVILFVRPDHQTQISFQQSQKCYHLNSLLDGMQLRLVYDHILLSQRTQGRSTSKKCEG